MVNLDFSDIAKQNLEMAKFLLEDGEYISFDGKEFILAEKWCEIACKEIEGNKKHPFRLFWIRFVIGFECLVKAVLINYEVDIFSKNTNDDFKNGDKITSDDNPWLKNILKQKHIEYVKQLNTNTLRKVKNKLDELKSSVIANDEKKELKNAITKLTNERRNNDLHFYFKTNNFMNNKDLTDVYLPAVNKLYTIF